MISKVINLPYSLNDISSRIPDIAKILEKNGFSISKIKNEKAFYPKLLGAGIPCSLDWFNHIRLRESLFSGWLSFPVTIDIAFVPWISFNSLCEDSFCVDRNAFPERRFFHSLVYKETDLMPFETQTVVMAYNYGLGISNDKHLTSVLNEIITKFERELSKLFFKEYQRAISFAKTIATILLSESEESFRFHPKTRMRDYLGNFRPNIGEVFFFQRLLIGIYICYTLPSELRKIHLNFLFFYFRETFSIENGIRISPIYNALPNEFTEEYISDTLVSIVSRLSLEPDSFEVIIKAHSDQLGEIMKDLLEQL